MQLITKTCEICGAKETIEITLEHPKPESTIKEVKFPGIGKQYPTIRMDLCPTHHLELHGVVLRWVTKTPPLDAHLTLEKGEDEADRETVLSD